MKEKTLEKYRLFFENLGVDKETSKKLEEVLDRFYNEETDDLDIGDQVEFEKQMMKALLESPRLVLDILQSIKLLDKRCFRYLWFNKRELQDVIHKLDSFLDSVDEDKRIDFLITDRYPEIRRRYGSILYKSYLELIKDDVIEGVKERLVEIASLKDEKERRLAEVALNSFLFLPGKKNVIIMYLFIKSIIKQLGIKKEIRQFARSPQEFSLATEALENHLYEALIEGEEMVEGVSKSVYSGLSPSLEIFSGHK